MARRALSAAAFVIVLQALLGCEGGTAFHNGPDDGRSFVAPPCMSGEVLEHVFPIRNSTGMALRLPGANSIEQSCGCTSATVRDAVWEAGAENEVRVAVETGGKRGHLSERATVNWQTADGEVMPMQFLMESEVIAAVDVAPPAVVFRPVEGGAAPRSLSFAVVSPLDVEWGTFTCVTPSERFRYVPKSTSGGQIDGEIELLDRPDGGTSYHSEILSFQVKVAASSPRLAGQTLTVTLPCSLYAPVPLVVSPERVVARFDRERGVAVGRFMLRGERIPELVRHGFDLQSSAGEVSHRFVQTKSTQLIVTFDLKASGDAESQDCPLRLLAHDSSEVICEIPGVIHSPVVP